MTEGDGAGALDFAVGTVAEPDEGSGTVEVALAQPTTISPAMTVAASRDFETLMVQ